MQQDEGWRGGGVVVVCAVGSVPASLVQRPSVSRLHYFPAVTSRPEVCVRIAIDLRGGYVARFDVHTWMATRTHIRGTFFVWFETVP